MAFEFRGGLRFWGRSIPKDVKTGAEIKQTEDRDNPDERKFEELLKSSGLRLQELPKICPGNSHLLLCTMEER